MATASEAWQGFRHWRRRRPFWGGLLLLLAGLELFWSANQTIGDIQLHVGPQGFLSYVLPLILVLCGLLIWFTPAQRLFYGILGLLSALYSFIGLNLGGFILGMVLGILGGALALAWVPQRSRPEAVTAAADPVEEPDPADTRDTKDPKDSEGSEGPEISEGAFVPGFADHPAAVDDTVVLADPRTEAGSQAAAPTRPDGGITHKAFVIGLVPLLATAALLIAGRTPARAAECPEGLPSRSVAASPAAPAAKVAPKTKAATPKKTTAPKRSTTPSPSASTAAGDDDEESDPSLLDGIEKGVTGIIDGVGNLLDPTDSPSSSPSAPPSTAPSAPPAPVPSPTGSSAAPTTPAPSATPGGSSAPAGSASPSPTPASSDIPCLGPRVRDKVADADDVPTVSVNGGVLEGDKLTMYDSTYDGVTPLKTGTGTVEALKFSMTKSVTDAFSLDVPESNGARTLIKSTTLTTDGNVRFYTPRFEGKLFGVIPVVFTPQEPPPLTLPVLWFTDVKIQLAFVRCDTLTAAPLNLSEPSA